MLTDMHTCGAVTLDSRGVVQKLGAGQEVCRNTAVHGFQFPVTHWSSPM